MPNQDKEMGLIIYIVKRGQLHQLFDITGVGLIVDPGLKRGHSVHFQVEDLRNVLSANSLQHIVEYLQLPGDRAVKGYLEIEGACFFCW